jgi:hypothetical protein
MSKEFCFGMRSTSHLLVDILTGVPKYIFQYYKFFHSVLYPSDVRVVYSSIHLIRFTYSIFAPKISRSTSLPFSLRKIMDFEIRICYVTAPF